MKAVAVDRADVWRDGELAGQLTRTRKGSRFEYNARFLAAHAGEPGLAVQLPLSTTALETAGVNLHTFFAGLLPEGVRLQALTRSLKTSADDLFSMLVAAGADTVGDVVVTPAGARPEPAPPSTDLATLAESSFPKLLERSLAQMGIDPQAVVPGVQEKVSAATIAFPLTSRRERRAWILKLEPAHLSHVVANESFFMQMARDLGLETANTQVVEDRDGKPGLLVERFDRAWLKADRRLHAVHQEDACQVLDRYPADKYRLTTADLARALDGCQAPIVEKARLLRLVAFSYLIGNGDLHGKNVAVLRGSDGLRLSPAYDLLSTLPYGDRRMALLLDGRDDNVKRKGLVAFGERIGVRRASTVHMLDELCDRSPPWIARVGEIELDVKTTADLRRTIEKRRRDLGS